MELMRLNIFSYSNIFAGIMFRFRKKNIAFSVFFLISFINGMGQSLVKDSALVIPFFGIGGEVHIPGGDMAKRFGTSYGIQAVFGIKTPKNFLYSVQGGMFFGNTIKENGLLSGITSASYGTIIGNDGRTPDIRLFERGYHVDLGFGKIFSFNHPNPNSGLLTNLSVGFIQHKIRIEPIGNTVYELSKKYRKGYDRLTNGILLHEFIGFISFGNKRLVNFYAGFDFMQGFTQGRRDYQYDLMRADDNSRLDLLYGFRAGWILPFYTKPDKFYYY
jgi:hypothetical protein